MQLILASALLALCSAAPTRRQEAPSTPAITDVDILQYALTLEHLGKSLLYTAPGKEFEICLCVTYHG